MCTKHTCLLSMALLLVAVGATRADLVSHWRLDEGGGTEVFDSGPGGNHGTITDNPDFDDPTWIVGVAGGALEIHGDTSTYGTANHVDCGHSPSLDITGPISIALWIRPDADDPEGKGTAGGETAPMCKAMSGMSPSWSWQVRYGWGGPQPYMAFTFNTTPRAWAFVGKSLERHEWCHIACSYDGTTLKCYLNGEQTDETPMGPITSSSTPVLIGSDGWGCDWIGGIDEVRIYDHGASEDEILAAMATEPTTMAYGPNPRDGSMVDTTAVLLKWQAGDHAALHDVYFGESADAVAAATQEDADVYVGRQATEMTAVGMAGGPMPEGLVPGATYYWRIDEVNDAHPDSPWQGNVWSFQVQPVTAWKPFPPDAMRYVGLDQDLSWEGGMGVLFHTVFFGTSFDEVNDAVAGGWMIIDTVYDPGALELDTTYYWRVDEFAGFVTHKGDVWSFTTRGEGGGVKAEYFAGMNLAGDPVLTQVEGSIDHSWGNAEIAGGLADNVSARWTACLEAPFTETYRLVTTSDDGVRLWLDGRLIIDNWTDHGTTDNSANVDLVAGQFYSIKMEYYENTGGAVAQLSWESDSIPRQIIPQGWLQLPLRAGSPSPAHLEPAALQTTDLCWSAGDDATAHDVYFGDDCEAVANADTSSPVYRGRQAADVTCYDPGVLEWGKTYCWRVDEINADGTVLAGAVWSFTTADFLIVEDFESYDDDIDGGTAIFQTWIDGVENGTGSYVGYEVAANGTFAETSIVYAGYQSMPLEYDNSIAPYYSETSRTWTPPQNWTVNGVDTLTLFFRGTPSNGAEPVYVALEDSMGNVAVVVHPDPDAALATSWTEWNIPLSDFAGVNATAIKTMVIGLGNRNAPAMGGAGRIFVDDIRVTKAAP